MSLDAAATDAEASFAAAQGMLLRGARARAQMTLHDVEAATRSEFKAASVSAYERGERTISVLRLLRLASLYGVALDELIPESVDVDPSVVGRARSSWADQLGLAELGGARLRIDLARLDELDGPGWDQLRGFVSIVCSRRRGRLGRVVVLRADDAWSLAAMLGVTPEEVLAVFDREGLTRPA
ncbi:MAG TPA: helix-turn-helix transcriptional regulator [Acidimicrobiales bacterium]|nr:helix-turn-helix transcriptional regulator [Acidimicrobiales bacterium]